MPTTDTTRPNGATSPPHPNGARATEETEPTASASTPGTPRPRYSLRLKLVAVAVVTAALALFAVAVTSVSDGDDDAVPSGTGDFVEALIPSDGSQVPRQSTVGVDLVPGWEGTLVIDGVEIPEDQLNTERRDLYRVEYTPAEGKAVETLPVGPVCISALVWEIATGRDGANTVTWCFEVV